MFNTSIASQLPLPSKSSSETEMQERHLLVHLTNLMTGIKFTWVICAEEANTSILSTGFKEVALCKYPGEKGVSGLRLDGDGSFNPPDNRIFRFRITGFFI